MPIKGLLPLCRAVLLQQLSLPSVDAARNLQGCAKPYTNNRNPTLEINPKLATPDLRRYGSGPLATLEDCGRKSASALLLGQARRGIWFVLSLGEAVLCSVKATSAQCLRSNLLVLVYMCV